MCNSLVSGKGDPEEVGLKGSFELGQCIWMTNWQGQVIPSYGANAGESTLSLSFLITARDFKYSSVCSWTEGSRWGVDSKNFCECMWCSLVDDIKTHTNELHHETEKDLEGQTRRHTCTQAMYRDKTNFDYKYGLKIHKQYSLQWFFFWFSSHCFSLISIQF